MSAWGSSPVPTGTRRFAFYPARHQLSVGLRPRFSTSAVKLWGHAIKTLLVSALKARVVSNPNQKQDLLLQISSRALPISASAALGGRAGGGAAQRAPCAGGVTPLPASPRGRGPCPTPQRNTATSRALVKSNSQCSLFLFFKCPPHLKVHRKIQQAPRGGWMEKIIRFKEFASSFPPNPSHLN